MLDAGRAIDIFRMSGSGCDPAVQRLTDLADDNEIVHCSLAQRTEHVGPNRRKKFVPVAQQVHEILPMMGRVEFLVRGKVELHGQKSKSGSVHIINATIGHFGTKITRFRSGMIWD
jgi:hypothetical protein